MLGKPKPGYRWDINKEGTKFVEVKIIAGISTERMLEPDPIKNCPMCKKPMDSFHHYYIYKKGKVIEVCKPCLNIKQQHRMFIKVEGKTRVID